MRVRDRNLRIHLRVLPTSHKVSQRNKTISITEEINIIKNQKIESINKDQSQFLDKTEKLS